MRPSMSNLSICIPRHSEWVWFETIAEGWFSDSTAPLGIIFFKNDMSNRLWSLCSPHKRISKSPPARVANAMTTVAQLLRASILLNRLSVVFLPAARCSRQNCSGRRLVWACHHFAAIEAGPFVGNMICIAELTPFYTGSAIFAVRLMLRTAHFVRPHFLRL